MACGNYFGEGQECYDADGNRLYFGLRLEQLLGVVLGYLLLFALLAMHYHKSRAARSSMAAKVDHMTTKIDIMESQLARLESIHIVLEAMPQLLEQRLHGTNTKYALPKNHPLSFNLLSSSLSKKNDDFNGCVFLLLLKKKISNRTTFKPCKLTQ